MGFFFFFCYLPRNAVSKAPPLSNRKNLFIYKKTNSSITSMFQQAPIMFFLSTIAGRALGFDLTKPVVTGDSLSIRLSHTSYYANVGVLTISKPKQP